MSVSITGKLNKPAREFQAGESIGFSVRLGEKYYDRKTNSNEWTNYEAVIFAKAQRQIDFYRSSLVQGAIISVTGQSQKINSFDGQNGQVLTIEIMDAKIGFISSDAPTQSSSQELGFQQPQGFGQPAPQSPQGFGGQPRQPRQPAQPAPGGFDDFDDDIPFS